MYTQKIRAVCFLAALLWLAQAGPAPVASPDSFKTPEYYRSGALDVVNAAEAYARGNFPLR